MRKRKNYTSTMSRSGMPDGKLLATGDLEAYYTVDTHQDEMGTDDKKLVVPVPGLVPDCELSFQVTTENAGRLRQLPLQTFLRGRNSIPPILAALRQR